ncbi:MAG: hypothetical protein IJU57_03215 [Clostridia bacterium]|nr:hypothetical protein [Clostridia bacterium]
MGRKGTSVPDLFGGYTHYDEKGRKIGESVPDLLGGYTEYDEKGRKIGHSEPDLLGGWAHYDSKGKKTGQSIPDLLGGYTNYDKSGRKTGSSYPDPLGGHIHSSSPGSLNKGYVNRTQQENSGTSSGNEDTRCYIATCVYGSCDAPEVMILRRFRDRKLRKSLAGRMFITLYYRISPGIVRAKGRDSSFRDVSRRILDMFTEYLQKKGY